MRALFVTTSSNSLAPDHPTGLWLEEFAVPYMAATEAGIDVIVASPKGGAVPLDPKTAPNEKQSKEWAPALLTKQFDNLLFDNGPHSFTRVVLRVRLYQMAKGTDAAKREGAIRTLEFMQEQGVLLALRDEEGPAGKLGREAYHRLLNPKVVAGMIKIDEEKYRMPDQ